MAQNAFFEVFNEFNRRLRNTDDLLSPAVKGSATNETDMSFCISLPKDIDVRIHDCPYAGHVKLQVHGLDTLKTQPSWDKVKSIEDWLDTRHCILQNKISSWMETKVKMVLANITVHEGEHILTVGNNTYGLSIKRSSSNIFYLSVHKISEEGMKFDIEVLPCFSFMYPQWAPPARKEFYSKLFCVKQWYAFGQKLLNTNFRNTERYWRIVFSGQEKEILHHHRNMSAIIRFVRQVCKVYRMHYIKPYFINSIFLWEIIQMRPMFWTHNRTSFLYLHMLGKLQDALRIGNIPFFWDPRQNLIDWIPQIHLDSYSMKIDRIFNYVDGEFHNNPLVTHLFALTNPDEVIPYLAKGFFFDYNKNIFKVSYVFH